MPRTRTIVAALASVSFHSAVMAQDAPATVVFPEAFGPGVTHTFDVSVGVSIEQTSGETALPRQIVAHAISYAITRIESNAGTNYSLDFTTGSLGYINGENQTLLTIPPADGDDPVTKAAKVLSDAVVTFTIDADGDITNIDGNEEFLSVATESGLPAQLFGHFTDEQLSHTLRNILRPADLVGSERPLGSTWNIARSHPVSNAAVFDFTTTWALGTLSENIANLDGTVALSLRRPADQDPGRPAVALNTHEGTQSLAFNRDYGVTELFQSARTMQTTWMLGELEIVQTEESTVIIERAENVTD